MDEFSVNNQEIINSQNSHAINKLMAYHILSAGSYVSVGSCLKSITNENLQEAMNNLDMLVEESDWLENKYMTNIFLLSLQMAYAEGNDINDDEVQKIATQTVLFLTLESLYRKGLIDLIHTNISYSDGTENLTVALPK